MKVIFLDIDGVMNSYGFYEETEDYTELIAPDNLEVLADIVRKTNAKVVLISSWRHGLRPQFEDCNEEVQSMLKKFQKYGIEVISRTGTDELGRRENEIYQWIKKNKETLDGFVILDDGPFHWEKKHLESFVIQTDFQKGGLIKDHVEVAVQILNQSLPMRYKIWNLI